MKHEKEKKKGLFNRGLVKLAALAVIVGCGVLIAATQKDCAEKEEQLKLIQTKIDAYESADSTTLPEINQIRAEDLSKRSYKLICSWKLERSTMAR